MHAVIRNERTYYYKSVWRGGRPVRVYVGDALCALYEAWRDEEAREARREADGAWRDRFDRANAAGEAADALCRAVGGLVKEALERAGYRRQCRHRWTKRR